MLMEVSKKNVQIKSKYFNEYKPIVTSLWDGEPNQILIIRN